MKSSILLRIFQLITRTINLLLCLVLLMSAVPSPITALTNAAIPRNITFQVLSNSNLWVDAASGNDGYDGLTPTTAFHSIQKAADIASPGTTVHILPGIYREVVRPTLSGNAMEPVIYRAENGPSTAIIRGSEPSSSLVWTQMTATTIGLPPGVDPTNIYYANLSSWNLDGTPRFVVELDGNGQVTARLPLAREPDWSVVTEWKYAEYWWAADGGSSPAACDPATNPNHDCEQASRSTTQLTDRNNDSEPVGIEPGNLTTLGNLNGATLVALDTNTGNYVYRRKIVAHDVAAGTITVDRLCEFESGSGRPGLGWGSKYYIENHPTLIDTPGEWWYDSNNSRLYLWPSEPVNPAGLNIEISRREAGVQLSSRSYITLDGLTMEFFEDSAVYQSTSSGNSSQNNTVRNATLRYANIGIDLGQGVDTSGSITDSFTLENSEVSQMDSRAIRMNYWWPGGTADTFSYAGIVNTVIRNNELHDLGFRSDFDNAWGALFNYADKLRFEGNHVHHIAQNGMQFYGSVIQSPNEWGFLPGEIKTGEILIKDNVFEKACLLNADCGALKIGGSAPDNHVFRDMLITGNIFRNTFGWTYISEKRGRWSGGTLSDARGMGGFGLYIDHASGIHAYRNIAYNNADSGFNLYNLWWDGDVVLYNNIAANSVQGIRLCGVASDSRPNINTQIVNNIVVNNEGFGLLIYHAGGDYGNFTVDHNLYYSNGWRAYENGGLWKPGTMAVYGGSGPDEYYQTLAAIQASTPWEDNGVEADPGFWDYDSADHDLFDSSWPDFHLRGYSIGIDRGTTNNPASLSNLLETFSVTDYEIGPAYDIGRYEAGFRIILMPATQAMDPGGTVTYYLRLFPSDTPYVVALSFANPSPYLTLSLSPAVITGAQVATLTVTDSHPGLLMPGEWYILSITGVGSGFTNMVNLGLLVGGARIYLPVIRN